MPVADAAQPSRAARDLHPEFDDASARKERTLLMRHTRLLLALTVTAACSSPVTPTDDAASADGSPESAVADAREDILSDATARPDGADDADDADSTADVSSMNDVLSLPDATSTPDVTPMMDAIADAAVDAMPDAMPSARITGRVRFLGDGTVTVSFNGVLRTFSAAANAAPIAFDVSAPAPLARHSITIASSTSTQTCAVRLPTPAPVAEPVVTGVEVRCVMAAQGELTSPSEQVIELPGTPTAPQRDLIELPEFVIDQPDATNVLLSVSVPLIVFGSTNTLGAVEVAFVDSVTNTVVGRSIARRPNGNTNSAHASTSAIMELAPGPHRIRPTFRHFDVDAAHPGARIVYGVRPQRAITVASDGPLTLTFDAIVLESLSTFDRALHASWMPTATEPSLAAGMSRVVPIAPAVNPTVPAGGGAIYAFVPSSASGPVQWDLASDSTSLARGAAFYDGAELPHAMLAAQPFAAAATVSITARLSRFYYRNNFGPADQSVELRGPNVTAFSGSPSFRPALTPTTLDGALFGPGVRLFAQRATGNVSWSSGNAPVAAPPPTLDATRIVLAAPRKVYFFARVGSLRVASDGPVGDVQLVRRNAAAPFDARTLTQISLSSSNAQNSQGALVAALVDLPAGEHILELRARPVTSIGVIPPGGIVQAYPVLFTPYVTDAVVQLGHVSTGALVLE